MKLILTENQLNLIKEDALADVICESIMQEASLQRMFDKVKAALVAGVSVAVIMTAIHKANLSAAEKQQLEQFVQTEQVDENPQADEKFAEKVQAVKDYMTYAAKNVKLNPENIQISPEEMVTACDSTNFDLPLMMAQAHMESCFGLTKRARETNSVFSIGLYDNGKNAASYPTQNASIMPYIRVMQKNYLRDRSVDDMLQPGQFVNGNNQRYASAQNYENSIKSIRNRIIRMYPILAE